MKRNYFIKTSVLLTLIGFMFVSCDLQDDEYVDLGLSVKWATCNVGAKSPEELGAYYTFEDALKLSDERESLPSKSDIRELIYNCTWSWTEKNGVYGYEGTSKKNGNSIFFPAAGIRKGTYVNNVGVDGGYWLNSTYDNSRARCLGFHRDYMNTGSSNCFNSLSVRLVQNVD